MTQVKSESMPQFRLRLFFLIFFWINPFTWILIPCSAPVFCFGALIHTVQANDLRNLGAVSVLAVIMAVKLKPYESRSRLHFRTVAWLSDVIYSTPKSKQSLDLWHSSEIASQMKWKKNDVNIVVSLQIYSVILHECRQILNKHSYSAS